MISVYLLAPSIVQNFKKIFKVDPKLWGRTIFRPKMARSFTQKDNFFRKPNSKLCRVHSFLHAKQSQTSTY